MGGWWFPSEQVGSFLPGSPHMKSFSNMISQMMPKVLNWPADYGMPKMVEVTNRSIEETSDRITHHVL